MSFGFLLNHNDKAQPTEQCGCRLGDRKIVLAGHYASFIQRIYYVPEW